MTRADFFRTRVTDPSITRESNSIPTKFFLSAPKEVFTSRSFMIRWLCHQLLSVPLDNGEYHVSHVCQLMIRVIIRWKLDCEEIYWHLPLDCRNLRKTSARRLSHIASILSRLGSKMRRIGVRIQISRIQVLVSCFVGGLCLEIRKNSLLRCCRRQQWGDLELPLWT